MCHELLKMGVAAVTALDVPSPPNGAFRLARLPGRQRSTGLTAGPRDASPFHASCDLPLMDQALLECVQILEKGKRGTPELSILSTAETQSGALGLGLLGVGGWLKHLSKHPQCCRQPYRTGQEGIYALDVQVGAIVSDCQDIVCSLQTVA